MLMEMVSTVDMARELLIVDRKKDDVPSIWVEYDDFQVRLVTVDYSSVEVEDFEQEMGVVGYHILNQNHAHLGVHD